MPNSKTKSMEPVQCKVCNVTIQKRSLSWHLKIHQEGQFPCDICGVYKAKRKDTLEKHMSVIHNVGQESIHDCLFCKKKLHFFVDLEIHLRSHTVERPYFCKFCPNECSGKQTSQVHLSRYHSLKRQPVFHCPICSKEFFFKRYLKKHMKNHFVSVEDFPFKCDVCSKAFRSRQKLNSHKMVHSKEKPFPCEICNKGFSDKNNINSHMRVHTGEKPYSCTVCKRGFVRSSHVKSHMRTHTGERPYSCKECNVAYSDRRYLQAHLKRCHSGY